MSASEGLVYVIYSVFNRMGEKLLYHFSGLVPRNKRLWVFGAKNNGFNCNAKYLFMNVAHDSALDVSCVWISRNKNTLRKVRELGFEAAHLYSLKGLYCCLRAGIYFVNSGPNDISFVLSKGTCYVNLWHGIPLKKIMYDSEKRMEHGTIRPRRIGKLATFDRLFNPKKAFLYDYMLSPSSYVSEYSFSSAFDIPLDHCLSVGYPRTDLYFLPEQEVADHIRKYEADLLGLIAWIQKRKKTYLYAPTWRDTKENFIALSGLDFADLDRRLGESESCLLLKMHPNTVLDTSSLANLKNIKVVHKDADIYPLLLHVDVLITDYSSIYFDFLLLDRQVVFFCFDVDSYLKDCRSFYFDYGAVTPGIKATTYMELCGALFGDEEPVWGAERKRIRDKFWGDYQGKASQHLALTLKARLEYTS